MSNDHSKSRGESTTPNPSNKTNHPNQPQLIVGLGASAGGLEALEAFFECCPTDSNMAFVVIQHLSPDYKSLMDELLGRKTTIPIVRVEKKVRVEANHIYLIAPKTKLHLKDGELQVSESEGARSLNLPIDHFFASLAAEQKEQAVGIILSGTGSDGTRGAAHIKEQNGIVIAQSPETCRFEGMPSSAISRGLVDRVLSAAEMPEFLIDLATQPEAPSEPNSQLEDEPEKIATLTGMLHGVQGIEFHHYRLSTIARRVDRRMKLNRFNEIDAYIEYVRNNPDELKQLHSEMLIGVTRFFRDEASWKYIEDNVIPDIFKNSQEDTIRVWIPGCSTGEEAYSVAILLDRYKKKQQSQKHIKIFATDVDGKALESAQLGIYSESNTADIPTELLQNAFTKDGQSYRIQATIRQTIVFSQHNLVSDPPFTRLDLVCCRNLLIYFQPTLQIKALSMLHFSLVPNGVLFLGSSESLGELNHEFSVVSAKHKIFSKQSASKLSLTGVLAGKRDFSSPDETSHPHLHAITHGRRDSKLQTVYESLLDKYVPASILINEQFQLHHVFGDAGRYLSINAGRLKNNALDMMNDEMRLAVRTSVARATKLKKQVQYTAVSIQVENKQELVELLVEPIIGNVSKQVQAIMVYFKPNMPGPLDASNDGKTPPAADQNGLRNEAQNTTKEVHSMTASMREYVSNIEEQLQSTRESLQATIEELETTNEELQSTNEEMMSSNEELQSANEELHSVNEELHTVNAEHQTKIKELTQAQNDIEFLLSSTNVATIFLDRCLRIRRFNSEAKIFLNLMLHDIGRSIHSFAFRYRNDQIMSEIEYVAQNEKPRTFELQVDKDTFLVAITPYKDPEHLATSEEGYSVGVVLSFFDISSVKESEVLQYLKEDFEQFTHFVGNHLKKPLRKIRSDVENILSMLSQSESISSEDSAGVIDLSKTVLDQEKMMSTMIGHMANFMRIRMESLPFDTVPLDECINDAMDSLGDMTKGVAFEIGELPVVYGDRRQITQVFHALLDNCIRHHSKPDNALINIQAHRQGETDQWEVTIHDNGPGMTDPTLSRAHYLFSQIKKNDRKHLGVGLPMTKRIINHHSGNLWIKSKPGSGTTVHFTLPFVP